MIYLNQRYGKLYLLISKNDPLLDKPLLYKDFMLLATQCEMEWRVRSLIKGESEQLLNESIEGLGQVIW